MGKRMIFLFFSIMINTLLSSDMIKNVIEKTNYEFKKVVDFQAEMTVDLSVPGLRMPKKVYKVYFKQPNKFIANTTGFGVLPNTGLFTSPKDNFDNLKEISIVNNFKSNEVNHILISGVLIADSLKAQFPNEYAKLSFDPMVDVIVDTNRWVITTVTSRIDTLKLFEIKNDYKLFNNKYHLPTSSKVEYFIKDSRLASWLKKDTNVIMGSKNMVPDADVIKGTIIIEYSNYKINKGIPDRVFKPKKDK